MKKTKLLSIIACISITLTSCTAFTNGNVKTETDNLEQSSTYTSQLNGVWNAVLSDGTDLSFGIDSDNEKIYLNSQKEKCKNFGLHRVDFEDGKLHVQIPRKGSYLRFELSLKDDELKGTCKYLNDSEDVTFEKMTDRFLIGNMETADNYYSFSELQNFIKTNSDYYKEDNLEYTFNYTLNNKSECEDIINEYKLDDVTKNKKDVELMIALMNWECGIINHVPDCNLEKEDLQSMINYGTQNGLNCLRLSQVLSQLLRAYGVKATIIGCRPYNNVYADSHVVVNAYSEELKQWVMLDPTHCLILKDESGKYVNVQSLRNNIASNVKMIRNENCGHNHEKMTDEGFKEYLEYMAKNSCYYWKMQNNSGNDTYDKNNVKINLESTNYEAPGDYSEECKIIITSDDKKFWE